MARSGDAGAGARRGRSGGRLAHDADHRARVARALGGSRLRGGFRAERRRTVTGHLAATGASPARLPNPALARTLAAIAAEGPDALYRGPVGAALLADLKAGGGVHAEADLLRASEVQDVRRRALRRSASIRCTFRRNSTAGRRCSTRSMAMLERWQGGALGREGVRRYRGGPAGRVGTSASRRWAIRSKIAPHGSTTHINVVDRDGNMVTLTQTLLSLFGSLFLSPHDRHPAQQRDQLVRSASGRAERAGAGPARAVELCADDHDRRGRRDRVRRRRRAQNSAGGVSTSRHDGERHFARRCDPCAAYRCLGRRRGRGRSQPARAEMQGGARGGILNASKPSARCSRITSRSRARCADTGGMNEGAHRAVSAVERGGERGRAVMPTRSPLSSSAGGTAATARSTC